MTTNYSNIGVLDIEQEKVITWLTEQQQVAYVSPMIERFTVVYERALVHAESLEASWTQLGELARQLSQTFETITLASAVIEDELLWMMVFNGGEQVVSYSSAQPPSDYHALAKSLCNLFGVEGEEGTVYAALARDALIATERHIEVLDALILPATMIDMGFEYLEEGEKPHDVHDHDDVILVNEDLI